MATMMSNLSLPERMPSFSQQLDNYIQSGDYDDGSSGTERMRKVSKSETIHSGHFMVSEIDDAEAPPVDPPASHESDFEQPDPLKEEESQDLDVTAQENTQLYAYGPTSSQTVKIDASLSKLFKCMSLAYCGKLTSPKWKTFKGLKLKLKDKIRLNNIIWRAWHIQYIMGRKPPVCQFTSLIDCDSHNKPEAVLLEGKYWKRQSTTVSAEYQKWRLYHKQKSSRSPRSSYSGENPWLQSSNSLSAYGSADDDFIMDFNDNTLFNSLIAPNMIDFPNPREITRSGFGADFIQPGLTQLQPSFDDYMDLDFLLSPKNISILPTLPEETAVETVSDTTKNQNVAQDVGRVASEGFFSNFLNSSRGIANTSNSVISATGLPTVAPISPAGQNAFNITLQNPMAQPQSAIKLNNESLPDVNALNQQHFLQSAGTVSEPLGAICTLKPESEVQTPLEVPIAGQQCSKPQANSQYTNFKCDISAVINNINNSQPLKIEYAPRIQQPTPKQFIVPTIPVKTQRVRSRSVTTQGLEQQPSPPPPAPTPPPPPPPPPQTNIISVEVPATKANVAMIERSNSLPVYTHRKTSLGQFTNSQLMQRHQEQLRVASNSTQDLNVSLSVNSVAYPPITSSGRVTSDVMRNSSPSVETAQTNDSIIVQLLSNTSPGPQLPRSSSVSRLESSQALIQPPVAPVRRKSTGHSTVTRRPAHSAGSSRSRDLDRAAARASDPYASSSSFKKQSSPVSPTSLVNSAPSPLIRQNSRSTTPGLASSPTASPTNAAKPTKQKSDREKLQYKEHRRVCHINAEQKRRCNIKNGFDTLRNILPSLNQNSSSKISKAAMLQKAAEHIRTLKTERNQQQEEFNMLKEQIESLNTTISIFQSQLPATGAPFSCQRTSQIKERFDAYVEERVTENWRFWIFSIIMKPLLESYNNTVTTTSVDEMYHSVMRWLDQNCSLMTLRPNAIGALRHLSTSTNVLTNPASLPQEAVQAATRTDKKT